MLKTLWRAFVDGLIYNDDKVASSKKTYLIQDYSAKIILYLRPKQIKNRTLYAAHTKIGHIRE